MGSESEFNISVTEGFDRLSPADTKQPLPIPKRILGSDPLLDLV